MTAACVPNRGPRQDADTSPLSLFVTRRPQPNTSQSLLDLTDAGRIMAVPSNYRYSGFAQMEIFQSKFWTGNKQATVCSFIIGF